MEKTEMMKKYEAETGRKSVRGITDGIHNVWFDIWHYQYLQWLEAKASSYDLAVQENVAHEFTILQALKGRTDYEELPVSEINWLQVLRREVEKAEAYDRLMSGGKKTLKEWANLLGMNVAVEPDYWSTEKLRGIASERKLYLKKCETIYGSSFLWANEVRGHQYEIPFHIIDYTGDWKDSLTLPDGWEAQKC